jgi:hypothetical protein
MKKLLLAAALATVALPMAAANALSVSTGVTGTVGATVGGDTASVGIGGSGNASAATGTVGQSAVTAGANASTVISAIGSNGAGLSALGSLSSDASVQVVNVGAIANANADAFASATTENQSSIAQLQSAIAANTDLSAQLAANDIAVSSIVAASVTASGTLVLYSTG